MNETILVVETFATDTVSAVQDVLSRGQSLAYIVAALLFILALAGLSKQKSAMRGNVLGIIGMVVALAIVIVATTIEGFQFPAYTVGLIIVAMLIGAAIGVWKARRVQMTAMPELVALLHSFVGAAAVLVGINSFLMTPGDGSYDGAFHMGEVGIAVFIGAVTFTGSIIANLKLSARISGKPLTLPGRNLLNLIMVIVCVVCIGWFVATEGIAAGTLPLVILTIISLILGAHLVLAIGGGDMPVVISMLNSYSGLGGGHGGLHAGERPAHHHGRARRLFRRLPLLHHVPRHESFVRFGHLGRVRQRWRGVLFVAGVLARGSYAHRSKP